MPAIEHSGFDAMGKPIDPTRLSSALAAVREMVPDISAEDATLLVGRVAGALERDQPYEAQQRGMEVLDLTGTYRLMAHLLCPRTRTMPTPESKG